MRTSRSRGLFVDEKAQPVPYLGAHLWVRGVCSTDISPDVFEVPFEAQRVVEIHEPQHGVISPLDGDMVPLDRHDLDVEDGVFRSKDPGEVAQAQVESEIPQRGQPHRVRFERRNNG